MENRKTKFFFIIIAIKIKKFKYLAFRKAGIADKT